MIFKAGINIQLTYSTKLEFVYRMFIKQTFFPNSNSFVFFSHSKGFGAELLSGCPRTNRCFRSNFTNFCCTCRLLGLILDWGRRGRRCELTWCWGCPQTNRCFRSNFNNFCWTCRLLGLILDWGRRGRQRELKSWPRTWAHAVSPVFPNPRSAPGACRFSRSYWSCS